VADVFRLPNKVPAVAVDGYYVVALPGGHRRPEFGEPVALAHTAGQQVDAVLYVAGRDVSPAVLLHPDVLALFNFWSVQEFVDWLSRAYGTRFTVMVEVTLLTLHTTPFWEGAIEHGTPGGKPKGERFTKDDPEDEIVDQGGVDAE
jgi:hypothetical protein